MKIFGKKNKDKKKKEFSKALLIQESILIWIITISFIVLAFLCILQTFDASFMWLSVLPTVAWGAYGVSQACYYKKAQAENTKDGIKYESVLMELGKEIEEFEEISNSEQ